jgi:serine/threonine-protein kinase
VQAGKANCWGANAKGQLGTGDTSAATAPVEVNLPTGTVVFDVVAGISFSCALTLPQGSSEADSVYCWGNNTSGQVGTAASASEPTPVKVAL